MKRHATRYTVAELEDAAYEVKHRLTMLPEWASDVACYYLEAELRRRKNNGPKIRHDDDKHIKDRERKTK